MNTEKDVLTKGNVIVNKIKIGDIHYEYDLGLGVKSKVITEPVRNGDGEWSWKSINLTNEQVIDYMVNENYSHYAVNLYDYPAYSVKHYV